MAPASPVLCSQKQSGQKASQNPGFEPHPARQRGPKGAGTQGRSSRGPQSSRAGAPCSLVLAKPRILGLWRGCQAARMQQPDGKCISRLPARAGLERKSCSGGTSLRCPLIRPAPTECARDRGGEGCALSSSAPSQPHRGSFLRSRIRPRPMKSSDHTRIHPKYPISLQAASFGGEKKP